GTDWARYALKAPVMLVHSPEAVPVLHRVPFADWADGRELLGGRRPTRHDLEYHLTTLFPPVRPRQWLEIRYLDSLPADIWPAVVFTLVTLLDDPVAADLAAEAVEPVATAWDTAARIGLNDPRIFSAANRCVAIAAERAPSGLADGMRRLVEAVEQGRCPADDFSDRVRLAHALGPVMVAIAANSPLLSGDFTGWRSSRQRVWSQLDSARCGPILTASDEDPGTDWARYALKAPVMLVHSPDAVPILDRVPFADWADGRELLGGRRPTRHDLEYHLTTLFPPVRPRRWLEIRYLDSLPADIWPAVVSTIVTLLDDPVAADLAAEAVEPVATVWDTAARIGLEDQRIFTAANRCVAIAAERAPAGRSDGMQRLADAVEQGRCPADDVSDRVIESGIAATVTALASGER
ncbi:MAG: glutamate--cysteine ligase, partial [Mycobacterium sp.]|nr:glutamate--cysteine ligase [Mycobacterium sp.]